MERKLINFVRENKLLYDKRHVEFKNQALKDRKWMEFATEVDIPVNSLKMRWKSLRDRFFRVRKNMELSGQSYADEKSSYKYYYELMFLCDVETPKTNKTAENIAVEAQLIEFIKENQFLYDRDHVDFRNRDLKERKWIEFAEEVNISVDFLKRRWKSMRDRFFRVRKDLSSCDHNYTDEKALYKYYGDLLFLCDANNADIIAIGNARMSDPLSGIITTDDVSISSDIFFQNETNCTTLLSDESLSSAASSFKSSNNHQNTVESEMLTILQQVKTLISQRLTPFRTFLDSVALTVEKSNCTLAQQTRIQMQILNVVQQELESNQRIGFK